MFLAAWILTAAAEFEAPEPLWVRGRVHQWRMRIVEGMNVELQAWLWTPGRQVTVMWDDSVHPSRRLARRVPFEPTAFALSATDPMSFFIAGVHDARTVLEKWTFAAPWQDGVIPLSECTPPQPPALDLPLLEQRSLPLESTVQWLADLEVKLTDRGDEELWMLEWPSGNVLRRMPPDGPITGILSGAQAGTGRRSLRLATHSVFGDLCLLRRLRGDGSVHTYGPSNWEQFEWRVFHDAERDGTFDGFWDIPMSQWNSHELNTSGEWLGH